MIFKTIRKTLLWCLDIFFLLMMIAGFVNGGTLSGILSLIAIIITNPLILDKVPKLRWKSTVPISIILFFVSILTFPTTGSDDTVTTNQIEEVTTTAPVTTVSETLNTTTAETTMTTIATTEETTVETTTEETTVETEAETIKLSFGELLDLVDRGEKIVIKAKFDSTSKLLEQSTSDIYWIIQDNPNTYTHIEFWAVADVPNLGEIKVISFTVNQNTINLIENKYLATTDINKSPETYFDEYWNFFD